MSDIFQTIRGQYAFLTRAEKKVADYVLVNPQKAVYFSITDLAEACGVGETSVFRFCRDLDQKGYQDFKMHIAKALASSSEEATAQQLTGAVDFKDSLEDVVKKVYSSNLKALEETYHLVRTEDIRTAVQWLIDAKTIHFMGVGGSMVTALEAKNRFLRIVPKVHMSSDLHLQLMEASLMDGGDVAIVFSYSGATKDTLDVARIVKEAGAKLIVITRYQKSPLGKMSDLLLLCGANEGPLQGGSMAAKMSQLFLLDLLYLEYFKQTSAQSVERKARTTAAISEKQL